MERIKEFEGLRGLMAMWVVLGHTANSLAFAVPEPLPRNLSARSAVDVFIILSGFVITLLILEKRESFRAYITRRFMRLFPVYLVCFVLSALIMGIAHDALLGAPVTPATPGRLAIMASAEAQWPLHAIAHLSLLHGLVDPWLPPASFAVLGQAWSVSVEWQFYLVAPLIVRACWKGQVLPGLVVLGSLVPLTLAFGTTRLGSLPSHGGLFALGIIYCQLWRTIRAPNSGWTVQRVRAFSLVAFSAAMMAMSQRVGLCVWFAASHVVLCRAVAGDAMPVGEARFSRLLASRGGQWLGDCSYSVYLCHMLVVYPVLYFLAAMGVSDLVQASLLPPVVVVGTLVLAKLLYRAVEMPFMRMGSKMARRLDSRGGSS